MPIRTTNTAPGMSPEDYDRVMAHLAEPLRAAPASSPTAPTSPPTASPWHLPPNAPEPTVTDLHNALGR